MTAEDAGAPTPDDAGTEATPAPDVSNVSMPTDFADEDYPFDVARELRAPMARPGSRLVALTDQLNKSQANLEATSQRFNDLASAIPSDLGNLGDRLSGILNGAMTEADDIRAEARKFATELRESAEKQAAAMLSEARAERNAAAELRSEVELQRKQLRMQAARLREQAMLSAVEIMKDAESQAVEVLAQMNQNINGHVAQAQQRLNELMEARSKIIDRVTHSLGPAAPRSEPPPGSRMGPATARPDGGRAPE